MKVFTASAAHLFVRRFRPTCATWDKPVSANMISDKFVSGPSQSSGDGQIDLSDLVFESRVKASLRWPLHPRCGGGMSARTTMIV